MYMICIYIANIIVSILYVYDMYIHKKYNRHQNMCIHIKYNRDQAHIVKIACHKSGMMVMIWGGYD